MSNTTQQTTRLTDAQGKAIGALISLGYGAGNGYMPFDADVLPRKPGAMLDKLIDMGLLSGGLWCGPGMFRHSDADGSVYETSGEYRLTPAAVEAYQSWFTERGWRLA